MSELTANDFEKHLFQEFHVRRPSEEVESGKSTDTCGAQGGAVELIEVDRHHRIRHLEGGRFHEERKRDPFTLLFRGSHEHVYISHIHTLAHDTLGTIEVFLNPVQPHPEHNTETHPQGRFYEVYFN